MLISGVERRRVWTDEQKRALVAAACAPGLGEADIALHADLRPSQLYRWRRDLAEPAAPGFAALTIACEPEPVAPGAAVVLEIGGAVLRIAAARRLPWCRRWCGRCGDDPGPQRRSDLACNRLHGHASGHVRAGVAGAAGAQA